MVYLNALLPYNQKKLSSLDIIVGVFPIPTPQ